jgi:hypothetical protein
MVHGLVIRRSAIEEVPCHLHSDLEPHVLRRRCLQASGVIGPIEANGRSESRRVIEHELIRGCAYLVFIGRMDSGE